MSHTNFIEKLGITVNTYQIISWQTWFVIIKFWLLFSLRVGIPSVVLGETNEGGDWKWAAPRWMDELDWRDWIGIWSERHEQYAMRGRVQGGKIHTGGMPRQGQRIK